MKNYMKQDRMKKTDIQKVEEITLFIKQSLGIVDPKLNELLRCSTEILVRNVRLQQVVRDVRAAMGSGQGPDKIYVSPEQYEDVRKREGK